MPEKNPEPKKVRYRETRKGEPVGFGYVRHEEARIVETDGPIPKDATETTDAPHDWKTVHK